MSITVNLPESMNDIPLDKYQKYVKLPLEDAEQDFINRKILDIFFDIKGDKYTDMSMVDVGVLVNSVTNVLTEVPKFTRTFEHNGIEWGFIPNLDKMTYGEFVDLQSVDGDLLKTMAVLYRPITQRQGDNYKIEKYRGYTKHMDKLQDAPLSVVVSALVFFFNLWKNLLNSTLASLMDQATEATENGSLGKDGVGIQRFLHLQMEVINELMKLHPLSYIKHSLTSPSSVTEQT